MPPLAPRRPPPAPPPPHLPHLPPAAKPPRGRRRGTVAGVVRTALLAALLLACAALLSLRPAPKAAVAEREGPAEAVAAADDGQGAAEAGVPIEEEDDEATATTEAVPAPTTQAASAARLAARPPRPPRHSNKDADVKSIKDEAGGIIFKPSAPGRKTVPPSPEILIEAASTIAADTQYRYDPEKLVLTQANHLKLRPSDRIHDMRCLPAENPFANSGNDSTKSLRRRRRRLHDAASGESFKPLHATCALVGNAGSSLTAHFGSAIDSADAVIRINQGPTRGYEPFVGSRTTYRLINKKWASVYTSKDDGRQYLLPAEALNTTYVVTRGSTWQLERLFHLVRRLRPDLRVYFLANGPLGRARWMLQRFREIANEAAREKGMAEYDGGDAPSSGAIAIYFALQLCERVAVFGLGQAAPDTPHRVAKKYATMWRDVRRQHLAAHPEQTTAWRNAPTTDGIANDYNPLSCRPVTGGPPMSRHGRGRAPVLPIHPLPYHYFLHWPDSYQLRAHPHHAFDLENDFFHALSEASQREAPPDESADQATYRRRAWHMSFCEPPPPCNDEPRCKSQLSRMSQNGMFGSSAPQYGGNAALSIMLQRVASERTGEYGNPKGRGNDGKFREAAHYASTH